MRLSFTTHGYLISPNILGFVWNKARNLSSHVARRDRVGSCEAYPFESKAFAFDKLAVYCEQQSTKLT